MFKIYTIPNIINGIKFYFQDDVPEEVNAPQEVWRVTSEWIFHSQNFNEWMSEEDYEVDENGKKKVHKFRMSVDDLMQDEKRTGKAAGNKKRKRTPSPSPVPKGKSS